MKISIEKWNSCGVSISESFSLITFIGAFKKISQFVSKVSPLILHMYMVLHHYGGISVCADHLLDVLLLTAVLLVYFRARHVLHIKVSEPHSSIDLRHYFWVWLLRQTLFLSADAYVRDRPQQYISQNYFPNPHSRVEWHTYEPSKLI